METLTVLAWATLVAAEPNSADQGARRTPNTPLQVHRAGDIAEIWPWMGHLIVDDLEQVLRGPPPQRCQHAQWEIVGKLRSKPSEQTR